MTNIHFLSIFLTLILHFLTLVGVETNHFLQFFNGEFQWHALSKEEQQKYYEMARKEREKHMVLYPGWSARDNYGKRKKAKERFSSQNFKKTLSQMFLPLNCVEQKLKPKNRRIQPLVKWSKVIIMVIFAV